MYACDRFSPYNGFFRSRRFRLLNTGMYGFESVQSFTEARTKPPVGLGHVHKQRITSGGGRVEDIQKRGSRWLLLVRDIAMPRHGRGACFEECFTSFIVSSTMYNVNFRMPLGCTARWMDMGTPKVRSEFYCFLNGYVAEILISEYENLSLSCQQS